MTEHYATEYLVGQRRKKKITGSGKWKCKYEIPQIMG